MKFVISWILVIGSPHVGVPCRMSWKQRMIFQYRNKRKLNKFNTQLGLVERTGKAASSKGGRTRNFKEKKKIFLLFDFFGQ